ncbi:MAG: DNA repair protein RecN [Brevinematia bacterium]
MLESIKIKDYAIIDEIELTFEDGFNVFTGESGVGKSIIVDALSFCLGERANPSIIRTGAQKTTIEAIFYIKNNSIKNKIEKLGFSLENDRIIIRREYDTLGKNKITINGFTETSTRTLELSEILIDFHGQHEHQSLLNPKTHIDYLDAFGNFQEELEKVKEKYRQVLDIKKQVEELKKILSQKKERMEFLKFTVEELKNANLKENEDNELEEKFKYITNYEQLLFGVNESLAILEENEISSLNLLRKATTIIKNLTKYNPSFEDLLVKLDEAQDNIKSATSELEKTREKINLSPEEIEEINRRIDLIRTLKRKYNKSSTSELIEYLHQCEEELKRIEIGDEELSKLEEDFKKTLSELKNLSLELSKKRINKAKELDTKIIEKLKLMAMEKAIFRTDFKYYKSEDGLIEVEGVKIDVNEKGIDRVEFLISVNPGEEPKPLRNVASGGEISRIMLAIKSVLADTSEVDMMVFDEIDVGIGGHTANVVGELIKELSKKQQIIVITHLPQVASKANSHFKVEKIFKDNKTIVNVKKLSFEERKLEIARMIGNENETGIKYAEELLSKH